MILAAELGKRGITVNTIIPGLTFRDFTPHARQDSNVVPHVSAHTALGRLGERIKTAMGKVMPNRCFAVEAIRHDPADP